VPSTTMSATTVESTTTAAVESAATTTVESAATTTVESAATTTVESTATTVEAATTTRLEVSASTPAAKPASALRSEAPAVREPSAIEAPSIEAPAVEAPPIEAAAIKSPVKVTTPIEAAPEAPAVPGSDSDEQSIHEVIRSPIAVRSASVRRVIIVAVATHRRPTIGITPISATYANSNLNLCVRIARRKHANR
jgi:hypothetical protein